MPESGAFLHLKEPRRVPVDLDVIPFGPPPGGLDWVGCVGCRVPLELHQPDAQSPDRLLGVCPECGRWYVMQLTAGQHEAVLVALPDRAWFRTASGAHEPAAPNEPVAP
jgi:hypothetical protein